MEQFNQIIKGQIPVIVDFHANWCAPCKMMSPILKQLKEQMGDKIRILKIDVDKNQEMAVRYKVRGVPTLMVFQNGAVKWSGSGVMQADHLASVICSSTGITC
ncbi:thioredoxin [Sunxiuqinia sp. A32]|uniref:thioredoxin n=1 Tax=Sunxiuqinia sp. A32 TaxID=3461496 RepID=UPI00404575A3